ncbi:hypothetical protein [Micromonospora sp. CPCC 205561]|uniref:hypothetical protein n=1 Tax=Micromonospora sp. CPCC 205561 TaxID=3122407 RepID=UPI002FF1C53B
MIGTLARHAAGAVAARPVCVEEGPVGYLAPPAVGLVTDAGHCGVPAGPSMVPGAGPPGAVKVPQGSPVDRAQRP